MRRLIEHLGRRVSTRIALGLLNPWINNMARVTMLSDAFSYARASNLKGDYLEFGVYRGGTFVKAYWEASYRNYTDMMFYAFDSFKGLPDVREYQLESNTFQEGLYSCGVDDFNKNMKRQGVDMSRVGVVEGWYDKILTTGLKKELGLEQTMVVVVDCDLYESTVPVLEFITDLLVPGAILIFDDWFLFAGNPEHGVQSAVREWLPRYPEIELIEYHKYGWHGNSFIVRRLDAR